MRIGFASDLHGHLPHYAALTRFVGEHALDLLILGGDLFPDGDEADPAHTQARYVHTVLAQRIAAWRQERPALQVAVILGNHDWLPTRAALNELHARNELVLLDGRAWTHRGFGFLGFSHTPPTPWWIKDFERLERSGDPLPDGPAAFWNSADGAVERGQAADFFKSRESLSTLLDAAPIPPGRWFFVCHAPPANTALDRLPGIDHPVGSTAVRAFIERTRPLCSLHGHIHESPQVTGRYAERVGATLAINPGQDREKLHAVWLDAEDPLVSLRHTVLP